MIDQRTARYAALVLRLALSFLFFAHLHRKYGVTGYESWFNGWIKADKEVPDPRRHGVVEHASD
ncbi:MAG: hypothetical protein IT537_09875 [Hyphomicrobiales bacterium]|nr:hypothetical protein [Hyphomicrobiales bacterium]